MHVHNTHYTQKSPAAPLKASIGTPFESHSKLWVAFIRASDKALQKKENTNVENESMNTKE